MDTLMTARNARPPAEMEQAAATSGPPVFTFRRMAGLDQALLAEDAEWQDLNHLNQKLWMAVSCPEHGLDFAPQPRATPPAFAAYVTRDLTAPRMDGLHDPEKLILLHAHMYTYIARSFSLD